MTAPEGDLPQKVSGVAVQNRPMTPALATIV